MIVTIEDLKSLDACEGQVVIFRKTFGEAMEVTRENLTHAQEVGLDLNWWGEMVFGKAYEEARALALKAYDKTTAPIWKAYDWATSPTERARHIQSIFVAEKGFRASLLDSLLILAQKTK